MTAAVLRPQPTPDPRRVALRAEREEIERRQYADSERIEQIRGQLSEMAEEGLLDA